MHSPSRYPPVAIIILNWNRSQETLAAMHSLAAAHYPNKHLFLVDNGSTIDERSMLARYSARHQTEVTLIENSENLGFAGGNNVGMRAALERGAAYVLLLNNDTRVEPNFLTELVRAAEMHPEAALFGPFIFFYDRPAALWFCGMRLQWKALARGAEHRTVPLKTHPYETDAVTGAALMIRSEALKQAGGFDERFYLYFEDVDLSLRVRHLGWKALVVPEASVWHKVSATSLPALGSATLLYYHHRNGLLLAKKHGSWVVRMYRHCWALAKVVKQLCKIARGKDVEQSRAILAGIGDYYRRRFGKKIA